jgi:hypothetical protein
MADDYLEILLGALALLVLVIISFGLVWFFNWRDSKRRGNTRSSLATTRYVRGPANQTLSQQESRILHAANSNEPQMPLSGESSDSEDGSPAQKAVVGPGETNSRLSSLYGPPDSIAGDRVDEASWHSFPASDAPPWRGRP